jgi:two-component system, NarL family, response regulator NreC
MNNSDNHEARTRVFLADDHALVRAGFRALLEKQDDLEVVGEAATGRDTVQRVAELRPDVVVMDIAMPDMDGIEATRLISRQYADVHVLALTMLEDERYFCQVIQAGACGFIVKGVLPGELLSAVRAVAAGRAYLHPSLVRSLADDYLGRKGLSVSGEAMVGDGLTNRERQVLRRIAQGQTGKQIAKELQISVRTVDRHRENLMSKLGLHSRTALVKYAIEHDLLDSDS